MSNPLKLVKNIEEESQRLQAQVTSESALNSGGSDGTTGGMEARVARLESDVEHIKRDVGEIKTEIRGAKADLTMLRIDAARLDERIKSLPTKWFVVTSVTAIVGLFTALSIFGDKLRGALGLG